MKYLTISGCVIVNGPPFAICFLNFGTTDPDDPKTFPNLNMQNFVSIFELNACKINSEILFEAPIIFVGLTALSVEINKICQLYILPQFYTN